MTRRVGRAIRLLRGMKGWRQRDLAAVAGVSRQIASSVERDLLDQVTLGGLRRIVESLGARLVVEVQWRGAELDRLLDLDHAALVERMAVFLRAHGWDVRVEVSYSVYGERGRYDLLAWHPIAGVLLVVEVKTRIGDLQDTIGRVDVKVRLAPQAAREFGWGVRGVVPLLVLTEHPTNRRVVDAHPATFERFSVRGAAARSWLRRPPGSEPVPGGLLIFRKLSVAPQRSPRSRQGPQESSPAPQRSQ